MSSYSELLKDPRWQKKRLEILDRDGWRCGDCGNTERTLHVHHKRYKKGAKPWEYENTDLFTLCVDCHEKRHNLRARLDEALRQMESIDRYSPAVVLGYVETINWLLTFMRRLPVQARAEELGEAWLTGFAMCCAGLWGHDVDAIMKLVESDGCIGRQTIMAMSRSFSNELRDLEKNGR